METRRLNITKFVAKFILKKQYLFNSCLSANKPQSKSKCVEGHSLQAFREISKRKCDRRIKIK